MATKYLGYRYLTSSAGGIKCLYFESTTKRVNISQSELNDAIGQISLDCSTMLVYADGSYNTSTEVTILNRNTNLSSEGTLKLGKSIVGYVGVTSKIHYVVSVPVIIKYITDNVYVIANGSSLILFDEGSVILPKKGIVGYVVGNKSNISILDYSIYDSDNSNYLLENPPSEEIPGIDPYYKGGISDGSGGTSGGSGSGSFDNTSDDINIPDLPTYSAVDTGFISIFNPSISQLKNLANYMWSNDLFNLDTWKKIFDNPMDAILGLSIVPVAVPEGGTADVTVGNIITTVSMTKASSQYVKVDCGSINVVEYWGGYMDYAPYTKAELYLPYCGTHPINIDDIMGKTVQVVYHVDILSGACVAYVKCGTSVLYSFVGQCSSSIPITAGDMTSVINGILSISASVGTMVATGGMSAPITALVGTQLATSTASNVMNMKPHVEKSGSMSGTGGMMGIQTPYLIITRPKQCLPSNQNTYTGYPSYITSQLSSLSGFTVVDSVHLANMSCTDEEKKEIENMLIQGVIL